MKTGQPQCDGGALRLRARNPSQRILRPALELLWSEADGFARRTIAVTLILLGAGSVASGVVPLLLKVVVDRLDPNKVGFGQLSPGYLVAAYAASHWLSRSLGELRSMYYGRADHRLQRQLSNRLLRHILSLPLCFHLDRKTGALGQTLTNGLVGYRLILNHLALSVLPVIIEFATMSTVLVLLNRTVFLTVVGAAVLLYVLAFWWGVTRVGHPARLASSATIDAYAVLTDAILNFETIKYFGVEERVRRRFVQALSDAEALWSELCHRKMENGMLVATVFALCLAVSAYVSAIEVQHGAMTVGEFVLVNAYIIQITRPLEMVGMASRGIAEGMAFIEKMLELLQQKTEMNDIERPGLASREPPHLAFERVSYSYGRNRSVLDDVSFIVPSGKTVGIVGASGSGKSSLIRLLVRLIRPTGGRICFDGIPISDIPAATLRDTIAVVPQDVALFNDTIAYNIGFGQEEFTDADIVRAARVAHIHNFITSLPDGYATKVGERGVKLSGGEKQRVAIARAAIKRPKVFVFDEATSSLDTRTEQAILRDLIKVAEATTTLIIAHRLSTVVHAADIVVLDHGRVIARGTHNELLRQSNVYLEMWQAQHDHADQPALRVGTS